MFSNNKRTRKKRKKNSNKKKSKRYIKNSKRKGGKNPKAAKKKVQEVDEERGDENSSEQEEISSAAEELIKLTHVKYKPNVKGGVYCFYPYETLDKSNNGVFKIEYFVNDLEEHYKELKKSYYNNGFFMIASLTDLDLFREGENFEERKTFKNSLSADLSDKYDLQKQFFSSISDEIIKDIEDSCKVDNNKLKGDIDKGWIYTNVLCIHTAFEKACIKYSGIYSNYELQGIDLGRSYKLYDLERDNKENPRFLGKVVYHT